MRRDWLLLAGIIIGIEALGYLSGTAGSSDFYKELVRPGFAPPGWLFGVVWPVLYALMGVALFLVWKAESDGRAVALALFGVQIVLNLLWSPVFFGLRSPLGGLVVIALLDAVLVATTIWFWRVRRMAGVLLLPYLAWVLFATVLNASVVLLN